MARVYANPWEPLPPQVLRQTTANTSNSPGVRGHGAVSACSWDTSCSQQLTTAARAAHSPQFGRCATRAQRTAQKTYFRGLKTTPTKAHPWETVDCNNRFLVNSYELLDARKMVKLLSRIKTFSQGWKRFRLRLS